MLTATGVLLGALLTPQDLVIDGVKVYTDAGYAPTDRVTIADGRFAPASARAPDVSLPGAYAYPGLIDAHGHLLGLGQALDQVDLVGAKDFAEVVARVHARAATVGKGEWVRGRGWDQNDWPDQAFPTHALLSAAVPDHPVLLTRVDGHAALANRKAMELAGLDAGVLAPSGGEIVRDAHGLPTGVLVDRAVDLVAAHVPEPSPAQQRRWLLAAQQACLRAGITQVHDAGVSPATITLLRELHRAGAWQLRVYAMLAASARDEIAQGPWQTPDGVLIVRSVKGYADGALGSRGAALLDEYADRPGHRGLMLSSPAQLRELSQTCADAGFQLCTHAIGDRAVREVLDAYEATRFRFGRSQARFRIEHAQIVAPSDFARFADLGVLPSMQPTHLTSDMPWAPARLGPERTQGAYAWQSFLALGLPVPFGSDFPVESHDPRLGLYAAVTTRPAHGGERLRPEQCLTREQALRGFTRDAAYAAFLEHELGSVRPGMRADLTVFDRDLLACPEPQLLAAKLLLTVIGGEVVWRADPSGK